MKKKSSFLLALAFTLLCFLFPAYAFKADIKQVRFSSGGGFQQAIINELNGAKSEILVQAYSFTSAPIAKALLQAKKRGIYIQVILDKNQKKQKYSSYTFFQNQEIPIYIDAAHAIAHDKVMVIDRQTVITGSLISPRRHRKRTRKTF